MADFGLWIVDCRLEKENFFNPQSAFGNPQFAPLILTFPYKGGRNPQTRSKWVAAK